MSTRIAAAAAALLFVIGAVVQIWSPQLGLTLMLLGVMAAAASLLFMQRTLQRRLIKHERLILSLQKAVTTGTEKIKRSVDKGNSESSKYGAGIINRVKLLADGAPASSVGSASVAGAQLSAAKPGFGRASTPDVANPFTDETLHSMLTPARALKIAGIFAPATLPTHEPLPWLPGEITASLDRERPDLIVLDEAELRGSAVWSSATTGVGTALMRELLEGLRWAETHKVPAYLLPSTLPPDVHSSALRTSTAVTLPLTADALEASAGAPQTPVLRKLQELARARKEGAA